MRTARKRKFIGTSAKRASNRLHDRRFVSKLRKAGWTKQGVWLKRAVFEQMTARAKQISATTQAILQAAIESGLRRLTTNDVLQADRQWHEVVKFPVPKMVKMGLWKPKMLAGTRKFAGFEPVVTSPGTPSAPP